MEPVQVRPEVGRRRRAESCRPEASVALRAGPAARSERARRLGRRGRGGQAREKERPVQALGGLPATDLNTTGGCAAEAPMLRDGVGEAE